MCGICGIYNFDDKEAVGEASILKMCRALRHRGPDDEGVYVHGNIGLGNRRLSIIDLKTGKQPIYNEDRTLCLVFNGEVYDYMRLRGLLTDKGHKFCTGTDNEIIVHLYEEYGEDCLDHFNGMFAFALWDDKRHKLFIARDRLGIKPLFYSLGRKGLIFGSEIKAVLENQEVDRGMDLQAMHNYFSCDYIPGPRTIYADIKKLPPGHMLSCVKDNIRIKKYWDLQFTEIDGKPHSFYEDKLIHLIGKSVKMRLQSDLPVGVLLSGGLDSSAIVALLSGMSKAPVKTFTAGFREVSYDERENARIVANKFRTEHYECLLEADAIELLPRLIGYFDEPFADSSSVCSYLTFKMAKEKVGVVLSGDGGDEMFGGYDTYCAYNVARLYRRLPGLLRDKIIARLVRTLPVSTDRLSFDFRAKRFVERIDPCPKRSHYLWKATYTEGEKEGLYSDDLRHSATLRDTFSDVFEPYFDSVESTDMLNKLFYIDMKTFLLDDNLTKIDRMSMANSLEARVPFLDHELVEFAASIPSRFKVRGLNTKQIIRRAFSSTLPPQVIRGKKKGFSIPAPKWLKEDSGNFVREALSPEEIKKIGLFDNLRVQQVLDDHFKARRENSRAIWDLLVFALWWNQSRGSI